MTRPVTRYGRRDTSFSFETKRYGTPTDLWLGLRRARAAALLTMALPGCVYLYQGEELGLPEVEDIPPNLLQDPMHFRSHGVDPRRDGCRVPLPWSGDAPPYGFSADDASAEPWLPQPADWAGLTVESQTGIPSSTLELYRSALRLRRELPTLGDGPMTWLPSAPEVLAFARGADFACVVNLGTDLSMVPNPEPLLAPPAQGSWVELWSSEDPRYGGSGTPESDVRGPWTLAAHSALFLGSP